MGSKILIIDVEDLLRQEKFCDALMPLVMVQADKLGMARVASYLLGMALGFCGEAGADEFEILSRVLDGINERRCPYMIVGVTEEPIQCRKFQVHFHDGKQYP